MDLRDRPRVVAAIGVALVALLIGETAVLATSFNESAGAVKSTKVATDDEVFTTSSEAWVSVPSMSVTASVPSGQKGMFLITFSAESACFGGGLCKIRVRINGQTVVPGEILYRGDEAVHETNSMQFLAAPMPAGQYTIEVQARYVGGGTGNAFDLGPRTLSVLRSIDK